MAGSLFSPHWYRVAHLKARLRALVRVQHHRTRDQRWVLLSDEATGRQHRLNEVAYQFIGRCDGDHTVQQVWDAVLEDCGEGAPTQDEVIGLLSDLNTRELLHFDRPPGLDAVVRRRRERARRRRRALVNPFAFRVPLADPSIWLRRLDPLARAVFHRATLWCWLVAVAGATLVAAANWSALHGFAGLHLLTPRHLVLTWICFPLMKALHELGHALAIRRWGGSVREMGITLLVLVPAPYLDASAASSFRRRRQRVMVGAAGILVELALAAVALAVWINVQPGLVQDVAFTVMVIGAAATLLVNGNPLLRFDGYYVLCDLFDLPNLATRSTTYWAYLSRRYLAQAAAEAPVVAAGERKWLLAYAPLSLAYRLVLALVVVLWLGTHGLLLGLGAAVYFAVALVARPLVSWGRQTLASAAPGRERARVRLALAALTAGAVAALFVLPVPYRTVAPAVVWLPEQAHLRPEVDGFIAALPRRNGEWVQAGEVVAVLENADLIARRDQVASRLEGLRAEQYQRLLHDRLRAGNLAVEIARAEAELGRAEERVRQLRVRARAAGQLVMAHQADLAGTFVRTGDTLGHVLAAADLRVRAVVAEADASLVRHHTRAAEVRLAERPGLTLTATLIGDTPAATRDLPTAALGDRGGGPLVTDPAEAQGTRTLQPVFLFDLGLTSLPLERVGGRAWVRFSHGAEPLARQGYRLATRLFLKHFDAS